MASTASVGMRLPTENVLTFLPLATMRVEAPCSSALASDLCSFRLAGTVSVTLIRLASRNLEARAQLVQPLRK